MIDYPSLPDDELLALLVTDNALAFTEIYKRYSHKLYLFSFKRLRDEDDAKDVVQDIFISLWNKRHVLKVASSLEGYLTGATKYEVLDKIAASLNSENKKQYYSEHILPDFIDHSDPILKKELVNAITFEVNKLPARLKEVYCLRKEEGLSLREIAQKLQISEQTVKNQLGLALKKLRFGLKETLIILLLTSFGK